MKYPDLSSKDLLGAEAQSMAENIVKESVDKKGKPSLTKSQIRRFYSDVKNIERVLSNISADTVLPQNAYNRLKLLKAKAVYNSNRKGTSLPKAFSDFIGNYVDSFNAKDKKEKFIQFCSLFEAFVGYSSGMGLAEYR